MAKEASLRVRCTQAEKDDWTVAAELARYPDVSKWLRALANSDAARLIREVEGPESALAFTPGVGLEEEDTDGT